MKAHAIITGKSKMPNILNNNYVIYVSDRTILNQEFCF